MNLLRDNKLVNCVTTIHWNIFPSTYLVKVLHIYKPIIGDNELRGMTEQMTFLTTLLKGGNPRFSLLSYHLKSTSCFCKSSTGVIYAVI